MIKRSSSDRRHEDAIGYSRAVMAAGPAASRTGAAGFADSRVLVEFEAEACQEGL
jgi:hypothetical protein